jgi:opacity protein-like surface antigen
MKIATLLLASLALLSACKTAQDNVTPTGPTTVSPSPTTHNQLHSSPVVQITEYQVGAQGEQTITLNGAELRLSWRLRNNYTYDAQKRLTSQRTTARNVNDWWEQLSFQYTPDLMQRYQSSDQKDVLTTLLLNEQGYIKGNLSPDEYTYNPQGYLTSYKGNGQQDRYTIQDGNVVGRETVYNSGGVQRNTYEYDQSQASIPYPFTFRGQQSLHLLRKQTMVSTDLSSTVPQTTVFTYYYQFDPQGRPVWEVVVANQESTPRSVREFTYQ